MISSRSSRSSGDDHEGEHDEPNDDRQGAPGIDIGCSSILPWRTRWLDGHRVDRGSVDRLGLQQRAASALVPVW
jgi:hypothetical protein